MNKLFFVFIVISIGFLSFTNTISNNDPSNIKIDSVKTFEVDDYPITNKLLEGSYMDKKSGNLISYDQAWFKNDSLNQSLVIRLATDYHRLLIYHFYNNKIPKELIKQIELHHNNGDLATEDEKQKNITGFINQARIISPSYFKTNKGFKLGDNKEKALKIYGKPDRITKTDDGFEKYEWNFTGDMAYDGKSNLKEKPLAKNSFGHNIEMYFQNNNLIAIILYNNIP